MSKTPERLPEDNSEVAPEIPETSNLNHEQGQSEDSEREDRLYGRVADAIRLALVYGREAALIDIGDLDTSKILSTLQGKVVHVTAEQVLSEYQRLQVGEETLLVLSGYNSSYSGDLETEKSLQALVRHHANQNGCTVLVLSEGKPNPEVFLGMDYWWYNGPFQGAQYFDIKCSDDEISLQEYKAYREGGYGSELTWNESGESKNLKI